MPISTFPEALKNVSFVILQDFTATLMIIYSIKLYHQTNFYLYWSLYKVYRKFITVLIIDILLYI